MYATDNIGIISPRHDFPIKGDSVYRNDMGEVTFPLGTYLIYESKAPSGYLVNKKGAKCPLIS